MLGLFKKKKDKNVKEAVKVIDLGKTIKLPNGDVIDRNDILQVLSDGTIIYVARDGTVKQIKLEGKKPAVIDEQQIVVV